jgi:hypothetical protein
MSDAELIEAMRLEWAKHAEWKAMCGKLGDEVSRLRTERDALRERLRELVDGLERTNWSSWQTTAHFWTQLEAARAAIDATCVVDDRLRQ